MIPSISVIIPTHDRASLLERCVRSLLEQELESPGFEVIVVDDGSTDNTAAVVEQLLRDPRVVFIRHEQSRGPATARNAGLGRARGSVLLFLDDDMIADPGLLRAHLSAHERLSHAAVIGWITARPNGFHPAAASLFAELQHRENDAARYPQSMSPRALTIGNCSIRRSDMMEIGGFDEDLPANEDYELALRLLNRGVTFHHVPDARSSEMFSRGLDLFLVGQFRRGIAQVRIAQRHPGAAPELARFFTGSPAKRAARYLLWTSAGFTSHLLQKAPPPVTKDVGLIRHAPGFVLRAVGALHYWAGVRSAVGSLRSFRELVRRPPDAAASAT